MKHQVIALYEPQLVLQRIPRGKELRPHGRWAWLHRLLWSTLDKLGAIGAYMEETTTFHRVLIKNDEVIHAAASQIDGFLIRGDSPKEILMGPNKFSELMNYPATRDYAHPFGFDVEYRVGRTWTMMGLPVRVLPQMEGLLVI